MNILIERGADVNYRPCTGQTPLMKAVGSRNPDAVQLLLSKQCDVSVATCTGTTAQSIAELVGDQAILKLLNSGVESN